MVSNTSDSDGPSKKKLKTNNDGVGAVGQTSHSVEEDGYGKHMHPTVSSFTPHVTGVVKGSIRRKYLDFSTLGVNESYIVPYQFFHWWTGAEPVTSSESNKSRVVLNKLVSNGLIIGGFYDNFKCRITNQATTRKRLLTQGSTTTTTHDFETSQNLMLVWDRVNDGKYEMDAESIDDFAVKVPFTAQGTNNTSDFPFDFEELATGHTKEFVYKPPKLPNGMYWEPVLVGDTAKKDVGKYVPSFTGYNGTDNKTISDNSQIYLKQIGDYVNSFDRGYCSTMPGLYLTQLQIPSENGTMKFIYRLCVEFCVDYTLYMLSRNAYDGTYDRDCVMLPTANRFRVGDKNNVILITTPYKSYI